MVKQINMKFYEEAKENLKMERDNIYNIIVMSILLYKILIAREER